jgi:hypothetical protein
VVAFGMVCKRSLPTLTNSASHPCGKLRASRVFHDSRAFGHHRLQIAAELKARLAQIKRLSICSTARGDGAFHRPLHRREVTDGLDDIQLRALESRLSYLRGLKSAVPQC